MCVEQFQRVSEDLSQVFRKQSGCRIRGTYKNSHYVIKHLTAIYSFTKEPPLGSAPWKAQICNMSGCSHHWKLAMTYLALFAEKA